MNVFIPMSSPSLLGDHDLPGGSDIRRDRWHREEVEIDP